MTGPGRPLHPTRRTIIKTGAMLGAGLAIPLGGTDLRAENETVSHGLSTFGELGLPADFKHFPYVNPQAPKGGTISMQLKRGGGNQNFDTFNTLNTYVLKGDGAAGMDACFDSLMVGSGDEPGSMYGLVARSVTAAADRLTYRFAMRPEARFHDGSPLNAGDVVFSLETLKEKGHPSYRLILSELAGAEAADDHTVIIRFTPKRGRDLHLFVATLPIFSRRYWNGRDFEAATLEPPLGSGAYKVGRFEQGRFIEFDRVTDYWASDLPVNIGQNNFDHIRYEYFRDRNVAFEAVKAGVVTFHEEFTSRIWATGYDFPAMRDGRMKREALPKGEATGSQGWHFNLRREMFADPRIREAIGLCFDFEWTNRNIMFSSFKRMTSYFENSEMKAEGPPSPAELALLDPFRGKVPDEVFGQPYLPPVSDGSGNDRQLLRRANDLLMAAGCKRDGTVLRLPNGKPFEIEFLDFQPSLQPHTQPFQANLKRLGIEARSRIVDAAQYRGRVDAFDFDIVSGALSGASIPGDSLKVVYGSQAARTHGSRNLAGIADPAVDAMIEKIANAQTYAELVVAARALDRLLRAGRYWVPMWWNPTDWLAYWDMYSRPEVKPKFSSGAPGTWWFDVEKAKRIGKG